MKKCKTKGLRCWAGGGRMFKDAEKGDKEVNIERTEEALETRADTIAVACPFCMIMRSDGVKNKEKEGSVQVRDLVELIAETQGL